jgi:two-component system, NarL family, invasion response regulator UvrY
MAIVALVDDHTLLRKGLSNLLTEAGHTVLIEADNGKIFIEKLQSQKDFPEVVLLDINMPLMDGYDTAAWIKNNHPDIKILALSMYDDEPAIIRMLKSGARGYILKDAEPSELKLAIDNLVQKGYHHSDMVTARLIHSLNHFDDPQHSIKNTLGLNEREIEFLKLASSELTYKEIAEKMFLSPRTIDGYRDALFEKLNIKSRVGLVLFAIKNGIVQFN